MADIILAGDNFSLKKLRSAVEQLEDAQNLMQKVYDAVFSTSFWAEANPFALLDGDKNMNVFDGTINELQSCQRSVQQKEENLRTLTQRMETAIRELAEADQSLSRNLGGESGRSTWERLKSTVRILGQSSSTTAILLIGAINSLFASDAAIGGETRINGFAEAQIANAYLQFDWTDIEPTDEEINEIAANSKNEAELLTQFQALHADKMRMESDAIYAEFDWRGLSVTEEEKSAIIQKASGKNDLRVLFEKLYNEKLDALPPVEVRDFREGVQRGKIRYIDQSGNYEPNKGDNGWGGEAYQAGRECGTACESMCMSYLGIDATPARILTSRGGFNWGTSSYVDGLYGEPVAQVSTPSGGWDYDDIGQKIDRYMNDRGRGDVSPVLIRYPAGEGHVVMILDKTVNPDGSWTCNVLGPSNYGQVKEHDIVSVIISKDGRITGNIANIEGGSSEIIQCVQYYRTD